MGSMCYQSFLLLHLLFPLVLTVVIVSYFVSRVELNVISLQEMLVGDLGI
jgi:hypothetical protein